MNDESHKIACLFSASMGQIGVNSGGHVYCSEIIYMVLIFSILLN
jgi:hypothetical protein